MLRGVGERPVLAVLAGAVAIAFSGVLFRLAHVSPSTGAFYRCVFALPPLWLLARLETRRYGRPGRRLVLLAWLAGPLFIATLGSALGCAAIGAVVGDLDLTPSWAATGWLAVLALSSQVLGWLLIATSLPRLPAVVTSILLTLQPVCSVVFAALILDESPSLLQLGGAACILAGLVTATVGRREAPVAEPELAG